MDNASKALIIAGGILITVMVISLSLYIVASARGFASASNEQAEITAIESFNRYYLSFGNSGSEITGLDALNLYNKAIDDSSRTNAMHVVETTDNTGGLLNSLKEPDGAKYMSEKCYYYYGFDNDGYINTITISR